MDSVRESLSLLQPIQLAPVSVADCVADALAESRSAGRHRVLQAGLDGLPAGARQPRGLALVFSQPAGECRRRHERRRPDHDPGQVRAAAGGDRAWRQRPRHPPELHDRIFELSFSGRRHRRAGKLGFGLWWVKTLMTRLGGAIAVASDGQHGACFVLRLPCQTDIVEPVTATLQTR